MKDFGMLKGLGRISSKAKNYKWPSLDRFINLSFVHSELCHLHLCFHAPKLDLKGASVQLLGAYSLTNLSADLVEAVFLARSKLADAISDWTSSQALLESVASYEDKFLSEIPANFVDHKCSSFLVAHRG